MDGLSVEESGDGVQCRFVGNEKNVCVNIFGILSCRDNHWHEYYFSEGVALLSSSKGLFCVLAEAVYFSSFGNALYFLHCLEHNHDGVTVVDENATPFRRFISTMITQLFASELSFISVFGSYFAFFVGAAYPRLAQSALLNNMFCEEMRLVTKTTDCTAFKYLPIFKN